MQTVKITKMNGCGNDFVILDKSEFDKVGMSMAEFAKKVCNRNFGVGADGMIIPDLEPNGKTDIAWYFYNSDGTTAQMCGNGMRCFAKYVYDKKLVNTIININDDIDSDMALERYVPIMRAMLLMGKDKTIAFLRTFIDDEELEDCCGIDD